MSELLSAAAARRRRTPAETEAAILTAAEALFRRVGYGKTTVADIAAELGMSPANVYRFFPSKSAINNAICDRLMAQVEAAMRAAADGPGSAADRLRDVILGTHRRNRELFTTERRVFDMVEAAIAENWGAIERHIEACDRIVANLVAEGIANGEFFGDDPLGIGQTVMSACCGLFHPTVIAQCIGDPDRDRDAERVVWLVLAALQNPNGSPLP